MTTEKTKQIFILGAPRSGTTFVATLLDNSTFGTPIETHFIPKYYDRLAKYGSLENKKNCTRLLRDILKERSVSQWQISIDPDLFYERLGQRGSRTISNFIDELMAQRSRLDGRRNWGDKTPWYLDRFELMYKLFPEAIFIYLVRDGRDVCLSLLEKPWGPNNVFVAAEYWRNLNRSRDLIDKLENSGQLIRVRYEDLVSAPEKVVPLICKHALMNPSKDQLASMIKSAKASNAFRWKKGMDPKSVQTFDSVAGDTLNRLGYEVVNSNKPPSKISQTFFRLHDFALWFLFVSRQNTVDWILIRYFKKQPFSE